MEFESESDLIRQLRPGVDGLLLEVGFHRGTFLPTVWRALPDSRLFLRKLKTKAGLSEDFWSEDLTVRRYTTRSWSEVDSGH
jgi:AMMECR1 domain-containing protein